MTKPRGFGTPGIALCALLAGLSAFLVSGCSNDPTVVYEHVVSVYLHGTDPGGFSPNVIAYRQGDPNELVVSALAVPTTNPDVKVAFLTCPPGSYVIEAQHRGGRGYYGSGSARPLKAQADPVVVGNGFEPARIDMHFSPIAIDFRIIDPRTLPRRELALALVTPVLRTKVVGKGNSYYGAIDEQSRWEVQVPFGFYKLRVHSENGQTSYLSPTTGGVNGGLIPAVSTSHRILEFVHGPPSSVLLDVQSPGIPQYLRLSFYLADPDNLREPPFLVDDVFVDAKQEQIEIPLWSTKPFIIKTAMFPSYPNVGDPPIKEQRWLGGEHRADATRFAYNSDAAVLVPFKASEVQLQLDVSELVPGRGTIALLKSDGTIARAQEIRVTDSDTILVSIPNLPNGEFKIRVEGSQGSPFLTQHFPGPGLDFENAETVTTGTAQLTSLSWRLQLGGTIAGRVLGALPRSWVVLSGTDPPAQFGRPLLLEDDGSFIRRGLPNGDYKLGIQQFPGTIHFYPRSSDWASAEVLTISKFGALDLGEFEINP